MTESDFIDIEKSKKQIVNIALQIVRKVQESQIKVDTFKEIMRLAKGRENLKKMRDQKTKSILIRWINYHLIDLQMKTIKNLDKDLKDSIILLHLLTKFQNKARPEQSVLDSDVN